MKKVVLSTISLLFGISLIAQNAELKLNLEKNKVYRFKSTSDQTVSQTVNGVQQSTGTYSNTTFSIKMIDAAADFIIAEVKFDTMIINTNSMGKMMNVNSATEGNMASSEMSDIMSGVMNRLSKNALFVKLGATGKVIEIVNSKMLSSILLKDTALITGDMASTIKTQLKNSISDDALKTNIELFTYNLPAKQVGAGDKWEIIQPVNSGGMSLDIQTTFLLKNINNNAATINAESSIKASANAKPLEYSGAKITYDGVTGMGKSDMVINTLTGLTQKSNSKTRISGDLNVSVQGMNMQIPMDITGKTDIIAIQ